MPVKKVKKNILDKTKTKQTNIVTELDKFKERIMSTSWHHMQTESSVKQLFFELIEIIKKNK